jgi:hypothetical protein
MRYTKYTANLPTRTTLRTTATRTRDAAKDYAAHAVVAGVAIATFAAGATAAAVALAALVSSLSANPFALLAAAATVVVAARAVPLLALYAARRAARTLDRRA